MFFFKPEKKFNIRLQSPSKSLWSTFKKAFLIKKDFKSFWKNLDKALLPKELVNLTSSFVESKSYKQVSKFWRHIAISHFKGLSKATTKETQNSIIHADYVSCTFYNKENFGSLKNIKFIDESIDLNISKKHNDMNDLESKNYNIATGIYFYKKKRLIEKYYNLINKNFYEDFSYTLKINNYNINQHLMYSINELEKIDKLIENKKNDLKILEFGAGYGRTANILLSIKKNIKYVIVDIPPSLYVSTLQFRKHYPNLKIFHAFDITESKKLKEVIDGNDITYIFPHQLDILKENYFDLSIMIGVINETEPKTVKNYMNYVNMLSKNLYMKIFKYSGLPFSFYKFYRFNNKKDYYISDNWKELFSEKGMESDLIYHLGYKIR
tara:strand:- start:759 stop:1901 length:1143 start_codon:yes stop_codon:yes gene_type:complete